MIDWHSHILPSVDDGSRDAAESVMLLEALAEQGVTTVIATPHFIPNKESALDFVKRRNTAYNELKSVYSSGAVEIRLGAEVEYYSGISRLLELNELCIEKTNLLLLEMPIARWTEYTVRELTEIATTKNIVLILAHIERSLKLQSKKTMQRLFEAGILMQVNATFFTETAAKRKALSLLRGGMVQLIGSDCHNLGSRPPKIGLAYEIISNKLGKDFIVQLNRYGEDLLKT